MKGAVTLLISLAAVAAGCSGEPAPDLCDHDGALAGCLQPTKSMDYYAEMSSMYFDSMDSSVELEEWPPYSERVARWEWPPWLKLTAYTREVIEETDTMLRTYYPSTVPVRECRGFDTQPFGRCYVVFFYDVHGDRGCPIYEEFTFNDAGEITWIEAWSDVDGLRPTSEADRWGEEGIDRLSSRIPGLGNDQGLIDLDSSWMAEAAADDGDVSDFVARARDFWGTWVDELNNADDDYWDRGCGW